MFSARSSELSFWLSGAAGALKTAFHVRAIRYTILALLVVDAMVLGLYVAWSFANTYDLTHSYFYGKQIFSTADWGLIEIAGYFKELTCGLMLGWIALKTRSTLFAALALFVAIMLANDSLRMHEILGDHLAAAGVVTSISELVAMAIIGVIPGTLLVVAWLLSAEARRRDAGPILAAIALVLSFAVGLDSFKELFPPADFQKVAALFEDGGELLSLTLLVAIVAVTFRRLSASATDFGEVIERSN